jgi:hypothetical protein
MKRGDILIAVFVVLAAVAWGAPSLDSGYEGPYDEGNTLCSAWRVAGGEAPYRDFWLINPPGTAYLLAGAFRLFGFTVAVERAVRVAVIAAAAVLVFSIARRLARRGVATAAAFLFVVAPTQTISLRPRDLSVLLVLVAVLVAVVGLEKGASRAARLSGALAGIVFWVKQDVAFCALLAFLVALAAIAALQAAPGRRGRAAAGAGLRISAGAAAGALPLLLLVGASGSGPEFVRQVVFFPVFEFTRVRQLPLSFRLEGLERGWAEGVRGLSLFRAAEVPLLFGALLIVFAAAILRSRPRAKRDPEDVRNSSVFLVALVGLLLLNVGRVRADPEHLGVALPFALAAGAWLLAPRAPEGRGRVAVLAGGLASVLFLVAAAPSVSGRLREVRVGWIALARGGESTELLSAPRWVGLPSNILWAARELSVRVPPGCRTFVGNDRHDAISYNAPLLYFLSGREGATRYDNLHPGVATTAAVQEEIIRDLEAHDVRTIVLWRGPALIEPNASSRSSGVLLLDDWIRQRFRIAGEKGGLSIRERR